MTIPVLPFECLTTTYPPIPNFSSRVCPALIYDEYDVTRRVVLYAFPPRSRGRINVISWFLLKMMVGLPSNACWLIQVEREHLACRWPDVDWPETLVCLCIQSPDGVSPNSTRTLKNPVFTEDLKKWQHLPMGICLHEFSGNFRKIAVSRSGVGQYHLLDGAGMYGGELWTGSTLRSFHSPTNYLAHLADYCDAVGRIKEEYADSVMSKAPRHLHKLHELEFYLHGLLPQDCAKAATNFLRTRHNMRLTRWNLKAASNG